MSDETKLGRELAELERTNPQVKAAAEAYDRMRDSIIHRECRAQLSAARRELEEARAEVKRLWEQAAIDGRRFDEHRRQLHREFELRTRALQASHDRLLGLLSGEIAREPLPPIIVNRECKKCGATFKLVSFVPAIPSGRSAGR